MCLMCMWITYKCSVGAKQQQNMQSSYTKVFGQTGSQTLPSIDNSQLSTLAIPYHVTTIKNGKLYKT